MVFNENHQKRFQQMTKLADMLRTIFNHKQKTTLALKEVMQSLVSDNQRGQFQSQDNLHDQIKDLCALVPDWICFKDIGQSGRFLRILNT